MSPIAWPASISPNSATAALEGSLSQGRLGHGLLLVAADFSIADAAAESLAAALLGQKVPSADYLKVEPANKLHQIGVEPMRALREFLQMGSFSGAKVAHISQADRLNSMAANLFLKVLEEPPAGSTIIMTTSEPYAVLPTLLSRVMRFRFASSEAAAESFFAAWAQKLKDSLLAHGGLGGRNRSRGQGVGESFLTPYALIDEAYRLLTDREETLEREITKAANENTEAEVVEALIAARQKALKKSLFSALETAILETFKAAPTEGLRLSESLKSVEKVYRLTALSLNTAAALEGALVQNL